MKKIIIFLFALVLGGTMKAQSLWDTSHPDNAFTFGVRAGVNFAHADAECATSTRTGFHAGVSVDYNIIKSFSITSGLYYIGKGFRGNQNMQEASAATESKVTAHYIQVPLLASWRIEAQTGARFHFNVGPYFAYGLGGTAKYKPLDLTFIDRFEGDAFGNKGLLRHLDAGISLGIMGEFGHVVTGISYEHGLADVGKQMRFEKFHTRNVNLTVGYNF